MKAYSLLLSLLITTTALQAQAGVSFLGFCQSFLQSPKQVETVATTPEFDKSTEYQKTYEEFDQLGSILKSELTAYQGENPSLGFQLRLVGANLRYKPVFADDESSDFDAIGFSENPWEIVKVIRGRRGEVDFDPQLWPIQLSAMDLEGGHYDDGMALGIYGTEKRLFTLLRTDKIGLSGVGMDRNWAHEAALLNLLKSWAREFKPDSNLEYVPRVFHSTARSGPGVSTVRELAFSVKAFESREEMIRAHIFLLEKIAQLVKASQKAGEVAYRDSYTPIFKLKPSF